MCKTCQRDETCVICNDCYHASNHDGHEVYFYHSQAGGCCDCGDEDAWKRSGTCTRHGCITEDPLSTVPTPIIDAGLVLLPLLIDRIVTTMTEYALHFTDPPQSPEDFHDIDMSTHTCRIYLSENHETREYKDIARSVLGIPSHQLDQYYVKNLYPRGVIDFTPAKSVPPRDPSTVAHVYFTLKKKQFQVCVLSKTVIEDEAFLIIALKWMITISQINDGLCCLLCTYWTAGILEKLLVHAIYLPKYCVLLIHDMMLALMANPQFKTVASVGYMNAFNPCMELFSHGIGLQEHNIFSFSVQFLNRPVVVHDIVQHHRCLYRICEAFTHMVHLAISDKIYPGICIGIGTDTTTTTNTNTNTFSYQSSRELIASRRDYGSILLSTVGQIEAIPMDLSGLVLKHRRYLPIISDIRVSRIYVCMCIYICVCVYECVYI